MGNTKRHTLTAALPYTNGPIHIGHLAGVYVPADIYARYLRNKKEDVVFICGSDEHGVAISMKARKEGISPQEVIDRYHAMIDQSFQEFGISFDHYSRTSAQIHHQTASEFFTTLHKNNDFIEEVTEQLYDSEAQQFLADRFVTGTCPKCQYEEAYGDQCEQCGSSLNATELINPTSTLSGAVPTLKETKHWFLPLDRYQDFLKEWILEGHANDWKPNVYGQVKSWLDDGLKPRAVTRDLDWGIPVPVKGAEGKVLYVWFDAPIGYISATKEWARLKGVDWEPYWKDENTELIHFIGKDNIVFHCIIFPAILKAEGNYILPKNVPANEFLNLEGNKLSTSKNWAVWLHEYLNDFPDQQDALRYALTANAPENKDNDFTWKDFQARNNNELVAIYGNFINRVLVLTQKYYDGKVPTPNAFTDADLSVLASLKKAPKTIGDSLDRFRFREASQLMMNLARAGNKYLAEEEPWKLIKTAPERVQTIMYVAVQVAAGLSVLSEPFLPFSSKKLKNMVALPEACDWKQVGLKNELIPSQTQLGKSALLFSKIEDDAIQIQLDKLEATKLKNNEEALQVTPVKETVSFEDFTKLDLRVGTILSAEKVAKTKKLLALKLNIGSETRTIVSGIAEDYTPEEVVGKTVSVLVNLAPRTLRGVESQGMILMTENAEGKLVFVTPSEANSQPGFTIR
jgi:methionyl-tRNA synthetase